MSTRIHSDSKWLRIVRAIGLDTLTVIGVITLAHIVRQATRGLLNKISSYSEFLSQAQTLLQDKTVNQAAIEQTLQVVYALTQKTMVLNYLVLPVGVAIIFCGLQAILWKKAYSIPYRQFIKYAIWFILASYLFIYTSLNIAMTLVYQESSQLVFWIISILLLVITSYITIQKILHPTITAKKMHNKGLYTYHALFLLSTTITFTGATLCYFFLQTKQSLLLPIGITIIGLLFLSLSRDRYIKESTKAFKAQKGHTK